VRIRQKLAKALGSEHQLANHDYGPTVSHEVESVGRRASVAVIGVAPTDGHFVCLTDLLLLKQDSPIF
jgi:hypothetical protein